MKNGTKLSIFNDPIYGFIRIPRGLIFELIESPSFQRLRRISQMGLTYLVFPGAHHTRFHHALGSMYLMQEAIAVLRVKGVEISAKEEEGLLVAILLHDIGHGPFSHAMEYSIVEGITHEDISLAFMEALNEKFKNRLDTAISIFKGTYPRKFMNQLVSGQLDMDRMDYLKRDSFYTGVAEGNINAERLITMLNVEDGQLVLEEKGIYPVEKFLMARRFMYWQVYLHKTGVVAEQLLIRVLKRVKELHQQGQTVPASEPLAFFIANRIDKANFNRNVLEQFARLDDIDVLAAVKDWQTHPDFVLSNLCRMLVKRRLLKIKLKKKPVKKERYLEKLREVTTAYNLSDEEARYLVFTGEISNTAYDRVDNRILMRTANGKIKDLAELAEQGDLFSRTTVKHYLCYPTHQLQS